MAKIAFSKLGAKIDTSTINININNQIIEVAQYLPLQQKLEMLEAIVQIVVDTNPYYCNPGQVHMLMTIALVKNYSNITFTEKQEEEQNKLYDLLSSSGIATSITNAIPKSEIEFFINMVQEALKNYYAYNNSVNGILENLGQNRNDIAELKDLVETTDLSFLKDVVAKLG